MFFIFNAIIKRDIPSNKVEIHIQTHARVLASHLSEKAITRASINKSAHSHSINHHKGCCLLFIQKIISIIHLIRAQKANIHIIMVHTS